MNKKKVFIAQNVCANSIDQINSEREKIIKYLEENDYEIVNKEITNDTKDEFYDFLKLNDIIYLIQTLKDCTHVCFCSSWGSSSECLLINDICIRFGIETFVAYPDFLEK